MTLTTITSTARRSLVGAVVVLALGVVFLASTSSAKAATGSPIGNLEYADGYASGVKGWAADLDTSSAIDVRMDVYRVYRFCWPTTSGGSTCFDRYILVDSQTQTANHLNTAGFSPLFPYYAWGASWHGFEFVELLYVGGGPYKACVTAINVGAGSDTSLGCVNLVWIN
jgi:hypothetical protein